MGGSGRVQWCGSFVRGENSTTRDDSKLGNGLRGGEELTASGHDYFLQGQLRGVKYPDIEDAICTTATKLHENTALSVA